MGDHESSYEHVVALGGKNENAALIPEEGRNFSLLQDAKTGTSLPASYSGDTGALTPGDKASGA